VTGGYVRPARPAEPGLPVLPSDPGFPVDPSFPADPSEPELRNIEFVLARRRGDFNGRARPWVPLLRFGFLLVVWTSRLKAFECPHHLIAYLDKIKVVRAFYVSKRSLDRCEGHGEFIACRGPLLRIERVQWPSRFQSWKVNVDLAFDQVRDGNSRHCQCFFDVFSNFDHRETFDVEHRTPPGSHCTGDGLSDDIDRDAHGMDG
jgi:hypothetical protein